MLRLSVQAVTHSLFSKGHPIVLSPWRLLDTGAENAPYNMALEKILLTSCINGTSPNTLHFLEFSPCVLLGYSQSVEDEVDEEFCFMNGIEINRRISGGGAIYMDGGVLGWEIIAKKNSSGIPSSLHDMYHKLCGALIAALLKFGIYSSYKPLNDVEIDGRKISGTGGTELDDSFIFHGTVLINFDPETMSKALKAPDKNAARNRQRTISMKDLLEYTPSMSEVKKNIACSFAETLNIEFIEGALYPIEVQNHARELPKFQSKGWIYLRQMYDSC